jgi:chromosomal replication initiator protein
MDFKNLWEEILLRLATVLGKGNILSFLKDSVIMDLQNGVMTIGFSHIYAHNFIKEKFAVKILETAKELCPDVKEIRFEIVGSLADNPHPHKIDLNKFRAPDMSVRKLPNKAEVVNADGVRSKMIDRKYTLSSFVPGNENRLAHAACMAVAAKPGDIYNPLFLFGGVGLGKTHLLQATGHEIQKAHPNKKVLYMTSEQFINEIVDAIGTKHTRNFKERYRNVDCLIIDDVQFFGNKSTSQQEFFHTFNALYDARKQIIISSDRPPVELADLEDRLRSRFGMGMVIELSFPDFETRVAILNLKCQELQVLIDRDVLEFIAYNVTSSIREMEGILIKAIGDTQLGNTNPTIRSVADSIRCINKNIQVSDFGDDIEKRISVRTSEDMIDVVANYFKLPKSELVSEGRKKEIMVPRQICMYLIRQFLSQSYETIGERFGGRNHTTVIHACNRIIEEMKENAKILRDVNALKKEIGI